LTAAYAGRRAVVGIAFEHDACAVAEAFGLPLRTKSTDLSSSVGCQTSMLAPLRRLMIRSPTAMRLLARTHHGWRVRSSAHPARCVLGSFAGCGGAVPLQAELQPAARRRPAFDAADYKGRNVIERGFNVVNPRRGLATRYDNLAIVYRGAAVLRTITIVARDVRFSDGGVDMNGHSDWFGTWADTIHRSPSRSFR
jgi:transposase